MGVSMEFQVGFRGLKGGGGGIHDFARYGYMHIFEAHFSPTLSTLYLFIAKGILGVFRCFRGLQVGFKRWTMETHVLSPDTRRSYFFIKIA
jgi:hypothetical protein